MLVKPCDLHKALSNWPNLAAEIQPIRKEDQQKRSISGKNRLRSLRIKGRGKGFMLRAPCCDHAKWQGRSDLAFSSELGNK